MDVCAQKNVSTTLKIWNCELHFFVCGDAGGGGGGGVEKMGQKGTFPRLTILIETWAILVRFFSFQTLRRAAEKRLSMPQLK